MSGERPSAYAGIRGTGDRRPARVSAGRLRGLFFQTIDAFSQGRVRVIDEAVEGMGMEITQIIPMKLDESLRYKLVITAHGQFGKPVRLIFVSP